MQIGEGQGSLACCSPWDCKELDIPLGCPLCPSSKLPPPKPQQLQIKPHFRFFPVLVAESRGFVSPPCALQPPPPSQGGGGWADLGSSEPSRAASSSHPAYSAPSPTGPLGFEKGGYEGGRGFRGHFRPRGRVGSRLPMKPPLCPSSLRPRRVEAAA